MGVGYFYALTPVYLGNRLQALLGIEQTIRMENFFTPGSLPMGVTILDENGHQLISLAGPDNRLNVDPHWMQERSWFGYTSGFRELVLKKPATVVAEYRLLAAGRYGAGADTHSDYECDSAQPAGGRGAVYAGAHV